MRPVIGITSYAQDARWGVWHMPAALVPLAYVDSIERAGGRAIVIPPVEEDIEETLDSLDGIVFSGGADVDPARYGAEAHPETDTPQTRRDAGEMALLQAALERDMPTLAICRGVQLLNVARGGDLIQHLPESIGSDEHKQVPGEFAVHPVEIKDGSRLAAIVGGGSDVTSHHHQGSGGSATASWRRRGLRTAPSSRGGSSLRSSSGCSGIRRPRRTRRSSRPSSSRLASTAPPHEEAHVGQGERVCIRSLMSPLSSTSCGSLLARFLASESAVDRAFWSFRTRGCLRLLAHKAIAPVACDADGSQSGDGAADRRARAGGRRGGRRSRRPREGGVSRLAVGVPADRGRLLRRLAALVEENTEELARIESQNVGKADRRSARRDRHGRAGVPLLRRSRRQARRRDDPRRRRRRGDVP